jgi:hypothetical protein
MTFLDSIACEFRKSFRLIIHNSLRILQTQLSNKMFSESNSLIQYLIVIKITLKNNGNRPTSAKCITKIRLSSHKLAIEQGRYNKTNRNRRTCKLCINEIEDEMHFILLCPSYVNLRKKI